MSENSVSYEEQQRALQAQRDGETEEFSIDAPQLPEVNPEVFKDVEPILFRGFLHQAADINGVPFVFKSLNHHEFDLLALMFRDGASRKVMDRNYNIFLAYGVVMVDGINVLGERERWIPDLADLFGELVEAARLRVINRMSELNRRASRAVQLVEAYTMETSSRLRWMQTRDMDLTSTAVTGLKGTEALGMNWGQFVWRALNFAEDRKENAEREWENAKFVAGAMAGKGINKIHSSDKRRRQQERDDRLDRRDKIIRSALFGEEFDTPTYKGQPMRVARTVEELADQLEKDLKGEQDWHDKVVAAYEQRAREQYDQRAREIAALYERNREQFGENSLVGSTSMEGLTPQEVQFRLERRRQIQAQRMAAAQVYPELHDPKVSQFNQRWFGQQLPQPEGNLNPTVTGPRALPIPRDD